MLYEIIEDDNILITPNVIDDFEKYENFIQINEYMTKKILNTKTNDFWIKIEQKTTQTKCRVYGEEKVDLNKRVSETFNYKYIMSNDLVNKYCEKNNLLPIDYNELDNYWSSNSKIYETTFELLKYDVGGFFIKHKDRLMNKETDFYLYTHMCLLYPPKTLSEHEGGEIIFYDEENKKYMIEPSKFEKWTFVLFEQKTLHEVKPITKGTRYVFKAPLYTRNKNFQQNLNCERLES